ncbi:MAG: hypothetical protein K8R25_08075 [Methanosarcinales archaeon]|nr:hypothetical protein [Methanosarcinales archaeon]
MAEILVVEDTILTRTILVNLLRENGHYVTEAADGNDAVIKYFENKILASPRILFSLINPADHT